MKVRRARIYLVGDARRISLALVQNRVGGQNDLIEMRFLALMEAGEWLFADSRKAAHSEGRRVRKDRTVTAYLIRKLPFFWPHPRGDGCLSFIDVLDRSEEHTSELPSLIRTSYAVFSFKKQHISIQH